MTFMKSGKMMRNGILLVTVIIFLSLLYSKGWHILGLWYMNNKDFSHAENALIHQVRLNPKDTDTYIHLVVVSYFENEYSKAAGYIIQAARLTLKPDQQYILTNYVIKLLNTSSTVFSKAQIHELLCRLPDFPRQFLFPLSRTIEYYPGRKDIIFKAIKECKITSLIPELENLVFDEDELLGKEAGITL